MANIGGMNHVTPVSILGLLIGSLTIGYGVLAWGYLVGRQLNRSNVGVATGLGVVVISVLIHALDLIPILGKLITSRILLSGLGAVVSTYYGLRPIESVTPLE